MNFTSKNTFRLPNILNSFRKTMAVVLTFSLLWQNCVWATNGIYTVEENLDGSRVRTYKGRRAGVVEPGTIRDREIHNVFGDLQLSKEGGLVFKGAPKTTKIYNRIYSANPIQLSGVIQADYPLPMVFANPGGIVLENPGFQNIHDLTLAAGNLAQTNMGMAYGVEKGSLSINKTFIKEENDVKNLFFAGRGIRINQSFLAPSETLILRAGQHIKGWNKGEEWIRENEIDPEDSRFLEHSIDLGDSTILRSKGLFLESLEKDTSIYVGGLLQSTGGDIIIRAKGDVYINDLCACQNLKIKTTGRVIFLKQALFGGFAKIKAAEIINQGKLIGNGLLKAKNFFNTAQGHVSVKSIEDPLDLLSRNLGYVEVQDNLKLNVTGETLKGIIKTHGKMEAMGQELALDGNIYARGGFDFKDLKKLTNKQNSLLSVFGTGVQGTIDSLVNEGKMDFSALNATIKDSHNKSTGRLHTRGHFILQGNKYTNEGKTFTGGIHHIILTKTDLLWGTYKDSGTFYSPMLFLINAQNVEYPKTHKSFFKDGAIFASVGGISVNKGASFELYGNKMMSCGFQVNSQGHLTYGGNLSLLCSAQFPIAEYFKDFDQPALSYDDFEKGILSLISAKQLAELKKPLGVGICFQATGKIGDIHCQDANVDLKSGSVRLFSKNGKVYANESKIKAGIFKKDNTEIQSKIISLNKTDISSPVGNTLIFAQESAGFDKANVHGAESVSVISDDIGTKRSIFKSPDGQVFVQGQKRINASTSSFDGKSDATLCGGTIEVDSSHIKSKEGAAQLQASELATFNNSSMKGKSLTALMAEYLNLHTSEMNTESGSAVINVKKSTHLTKANLAGETTIIDGGEKLILSESHLKGSNNVVKAKTINTNSNKTEGTTYFQGIESLQIQDLGANGDVSASAQTINFSGNNSANVLEAQGKHIKNDGVLHGKKSLTLLGETVEQLRTTESGEKSYIQASKHYIDNANSRNESGGDLSLISEKTKCFKGYQKAKHTLVVVMKDMNLFDFLNQTEARITKAQLTETEISFKEDFVLDRTLHLWAKSLENKKKFTATKDFIIHMQTLIMNEGSMVVKGDFDLESSVLVNSGLMEGKSVNAKAEKAFIESSIERKNIQGWKKKDKGYEEKIKSQAEVRSTVGDVKVETSELLQARGAKFEAKLNLKVKSVGFLYLGAQQLSSESSNSGKGSKDHGSTLKNHKTQMVSGGNADIDSGKEGMIFEGVDVKSAGYIHATSGGDLESRTNHNLMQEEKKKGSGDTKKNKQTSEDTVNQNGFEAKEDVLFKSEGNNIQQASHIKSDDKVVIESKQGKVILKVDKSSYMTSTQKSSESVVWRKEEQKGRYDETVEELKIRAKEGVEIKGAKGISVEFGKALDELEKDPNTSWVKNLRKNPKVKWTQVEEEHKKWNKKFQGLTAAGAAIIALAVSIATAGAGIAGAVGTAVLQAGGGATFAGVIGTGASAAFNAVVQQATISLVNNQGNIAKVLKDLSSTESIKGILTSTAVAGLTYGLCNQLGIPQEGTGFTDRLQKSAVQTGTSTASNVVIQHQDLGEAALQGVVNIAASTAAGYAAGQVGAEYRDGYLDYVNHKLLHFVIGAGLGAASNLKDPGAGALGGGIGAMGAEIFGGALPNTIDIQDRADVGRMIGAVAALLAKQDVNAAVLAGTNAVQNNMIPTYQEMEELNAATEIVGAHLGAKIPACVLFRDDLHTHIDNVFDSIPFIDSLQSLHISQMLPFPIQAIVYSRSISHLGVDLIMPVTALDIGLSLTVVGKVPGLAVKGLGMASKGLGKGVQFVSNAWGKIGAMEGLAFRAPKIVQDLERWKFNPVIFDKKVTWTAPNGTQQTYKVFQRNDINWDMVRTNGDKRFVGKTNAEAARAGLAPQLDDGYLATLHHIGQDSRGAIAEASMRYHGVGKSGQNILHGQFGKNKPHPVFPVDRKKFNQDTRDYWKMRGFNQ